MANFNNFWHATSGKNLMQMTVVLATSLKYCRCTTFWNAEVFWSFTTMNSYWMAHASAQKWLTEKRQIRLATIVTAHTYTKGIVCTRPIMAVVVTFWLTIPSSRHQNERFDQAMEMRP